MPTAAIATFGAGRLDPIKHAEDARLDSINLDASLTLLKGTILGEKSGNNDVQTLSTTGTVTAGTFILNTGAVPGVASTAAIAWNATAAAIVAALELLPLVGVGGVTATGGPLPATPVVLTFKGILANKAITIMTATDTLTGGSSAIAHTTTGSPGTPGTYKAYKYSNTDGSQIPRLILQYDCVTDASGNVTIGTAAAGAGEWGQTFKSVPAYRSGVFRSEDLVGLDDNAAGILGRYLQGNAASGEFSLAGT